MGGGDNHSGDTMITDVLSGGIDKQFVLRGALLRRNIDELRALIASLFGNGEAGAMFIPQPTLLGQQVLFQDAAGTTPANADGDPAGLALDPSRKLELGTNLIPTVDFTDTSSAAWPLQSRVQDVTADSFAVADGETDGGIAGRQGEYGKRYTAVVHYTRLTPGDIALTVGSVSTSDEQVRETMATSGTITATRTVTNTNNNTLYIRLYGAGASVRIDAIELQELQGNHATQPVSADRPLYRTDGSLHWLAHDQVGDNLVASLPNLGTNATLAYANASGVTILEGQTISGDTIIPQEAELYGAIYLDRPFTASETAQVTDYLNKLRGA